MSFTKHVSREEWGDLSAHFRDLNYRQCGSYSEFGAKRVGATAEFLAIYEEKDLIGSVSVRIKRVPYLSVGIAYVNNGPLSRNGDAWSASKFSSCLDALTQKYVKNQSLLLRIAPPYAGEKSEEEISRLFAERGFQRKENKNSHETFILDLRFSSEEIRLNLDAKWRGHLSKAQRSYIKITRSSALAAFDSLEPIFNDLLQRKGFATTEDLAFFRRVQAGAVGDETFVTHLAWHDSELVGGHIGSFVGDSAVYLLGAVTPRGRDLRASYLLQWAVIEFAKSRGNIFYDLGGVDSNANPGVYSFKRGLNGQLIQSDATYELGSSYFTGCVIRSLENLYNNLSRNK